MEIEKNSFFILVRDIKKLIRDARYNALNAVKRNGVIVLVAECSEGHGNEIFFEWMEKYKTLKEIEKQIKKHFLIGGHKAYYLMRTLEKVKVILVSVRRADNSTRPPSGVASSALVIMFIRILMVNEKSVLMSISGTLPLMTRFFPPAAT